MKSSKAQILAKFHKIPVLRFEDQQLTSFGGLLIFQQLLNCLQLKQRLKACFAHLKLSPIFGRHLVVLLLIVHLLLGFRRLGEVDYYRDDPIVLRLMGLRRLPNVATISRALGQMDADGVEQVRQLSRGMVLEGLQREQLSRVTLDFDGSVQSTKGHAEGTAVGFNKNKKGARSSYPLFCTVAQTGQFFDLFHRPGNVHDSNGAAEFMLARFTEARSALKNTALNPAWTPPFSISRFYQAFTTTRCTLPPRCPLSALRRSRPWSSNASAGKIGREWSYFETQWKPKCWMAAFGSSSPARKPNASSKAPCSSICSNPGISISTTGCFVTNKGGSAKSVVLFHHGRGGQEAVFGDAKNDAALDAIPTKRLIGNQIFTLCAMTAHNLSRELQMLAAPAAAKALPKRPAAWAFEKLDTLRHRVIQRAGRFTRPQGQLTLTMSANEAVRKDLMHFLDVLQKAA